MVTAEQVSATRPAPALKPNSEALLRGARTGGAGLKLLAFWFSKSPKGGQVLVLFQQQVTMLHHWRRTLGGQDSRWSEAVHTDVNTVVQHKWQERDLETQRIH